MAKRQLHHKAFTLIEVMVSVMIVSVVIAALLQMRGETTHKFLELKKILKELPYSSFLISQDKSYRVGEEFDVESDLRDRLKTLKMRVDYKTVDTLESNDFVLEFGKTTLTSESFSLSLVRLKLQ